MNRLLNARRAELLLALLCTAGDLQDLLRDLLC
jgi:hypothetical protein